MQGLDKAVAEFNARAAREGWDQYCDPANGFVMPECFELAALWTRLTADGALPKRDAFTARMLKPYLARLAMVELLEQEPPRLRFRLIGTTLTGTLSERTGQHFDDKSATPQQTARWTQSALLTLAARQPMRFYMAGEAAVFGEMLTLPLADANGAPRFVLAYGKYDPTRDWSRRAERAEA